MEAAGACHSTEVRVKLENGPICLGKSLQGKLCLHGYSSSPAQAPCSHSALLTLLSRVALAGKSPLCSCRIQAASTRALRDACTCHARPCLLRTHSVQGAGRRAGAQDAGSSCDHAAEPLQCCRAHLPHLPCRPCQTRQPGDLCSACRTLPGYI
jgi:hypothetical protein